MSETKRYCPNCEDEVFYVDVSFTSGTKAWYCRSCKEEVIPIYDWNRKMPKNSSSMDLVEEFNRLIAEGGRDLQEVVLEPNPCAPRNKDWNTKPVVSIYPGVQYFDINFEREYECEYDPEDKS